MEYYEIVELQQGESCLFERLSPKEKLIVAVGHCLVAFEGQRIFAMEKTNVNLRTADGAFKVEGLAPQTTVVRMCGRWGEELGGSGVFRVVRPEQRIERGDPVTYRKETSFDNHYHDCDEYWIVFAGRGVAVSEGKHYEVGPGDCVATGKGHHHDFPIVHEPVSAVFFETTLEGHKRRGHLWDHTHGAAEPDRERI
jgi:mannose-6-phosphate isomerase-like protein (cupin superfamily)